MRWSRSLLPFAGRARDGSAPDSGPAGDGHLRRLRGRPARHRRRHGAGAVHHHDLHRARLPRPPGGAHGDRHRARRDPVHVDVLGARAPQARRGLVAGGEAAGAGHRDRFLDRPLDRQADGHRGAGLLLRLLRRLLGDPDADREKAGGGARAARQGRHVLDGWPDRRPVRPGGRRRWLRLGAVHDAL